MGDDFIVGKDPMTQEYQFQLISRHAASENSRAIHGLGRCFEGKNGGAMVETRPEAAGQGRVTALIQARLKPSLGANDPPLRLSRFLSRVVESHRPVYLRRRWAMVLCAYPSHSSVKKVIRVTCPTIGKL